MARGHALRLDYEPAEFFLKARKASDVWIMAREGHRDRGGKKYLSH